MPLPTEQTPLKREVQISEFDNIWNQLTLELAKPSLHPELKSDSETITRLRAELERLLPSLP